MENDANPESPQSNKIPLHESDAGHEASRSTTELRKLFARQISSRQKFEENIERWVDPLFANINKDELVGFDDSEKKLASISKKHATLSRVTQLTLIKNAVSGDKQSWNILIDYFSKKLRSMARQRTVRDHEDLYQEGAIALINGVKKFDAARSANADAFILSEVKYAMLLYIAEHYGMICLPGHMRENLRQLDAAVKFLYARLGREPSDQELAIKLHVSPQYIQQLREVRAISSVKSLDEPSETEPGGGNREDAFDMPDTSTDTESKNLIEEILKLLHGLSEKERLVLQLHFGLDGNKESTLESIGARFKITKQRVGQIESRALLKLKQQYLAQVDHCSPMPKPPPAASDASFSTTMASWLCLIVLKRLQHCAGRELRSLLFNNLVDQVINKIQIDTSTGSCLIVREANELVYWTIQHLIADGLIREAFGGEELVMTEKGSSWLFYSK